MRRLLFFVLIAVSVIPSHGQKQQTGKAYGSVGYITSKKAFMQDASGVTLIFTAVRESGQPFRRAKSAIMFRNSRKANTVSPSFPRTAVDSR
jgi:hypothetical protein